MGLDAATLAAAVVVFALPIAWPRGAFARRIQLRHVAAQSDLRPSFPGLAIQ